MKKKLLFGLLLLCIVFALQGCKQKDPVKKPVSPARPTDTETPIIPPKELEYTNMEIDVSKVKKEFINEAFDSKGLVVYGITKDGEKKELAESEYTINLVYNDEFVSGFTEPGEYGVRIYFAEPDSTVFFIEYFIVKYINTNNE